MQHRTKHLEQRSLKQRKACPCFHQRPDKSPLSKGHSHRLQSFGLDSSDRVLCRISANMSIRRGWVECQFQVELTRSRCDAHRRPCPGCPIAPTSGPGRGPRRSGEGHSRKRNREVPSEGVEAIVSVREAFILAYQRLVVGSDAKPCKFAGAGSKTMESSP